MKGKPVCFAPRTKSRIAANPANRWKQAVYYPLEFRARELWEKDDHEIDPDRPYKLRLRYTRDDSNDGISLSIARKCLHLARPMESGQ